MLVWKCIKRDRTSRDEFIYPAVGETVKTDDWIEEDCLRGGLHGCVAGGKSAGSIRYRPGGIWLLIDARPPLVEIQVSHLKFKVGEIVAEFDKFSDLLTRPEMKGQRGFYHFGSGTYQVGGAFGYVFNETGEATCPDGFRCSVYGLTAANGPLCVSAGPEGVLNGEGIVGKTFDRYGTKLQPYAWYSQEPANTWTNVTLK